MKYLITGATGGFGSRAVHTLLKHVPAEDVIITARDASKASFQKVQGVKVRQADFNDADAIKKAFEGADVALIVSTNEPVDEKRIAQHKNAIGAAKCADVKRVLYVSVVNDPEHPTPLTSAHIMTERLLRESGLTYTIIRNDAYLETETATIAGALQGRPVVTTAKEGKIGFAPRANYADGAVAAMLKEDEGDKTYELAGIPITMDEFATVLGEVIQRDVAVDHVDDEQYARMLSSTGMAEPLVAMYVKSKATYRTGVMDVDPVQLDGLLASIDEKPTPLFLGMKTIVEGLQGQ